MSLGDTALEWVGPEKLTGTATAGTLAIFPVCRFSETRGTKASAVSPEKWFPREVVWGHSPRIAWRMSLGRLGTQPSNGLERRN